MTPPPFVGVAGIEVPQPRIDLYEISGYPVALESTLAERKIARMLGTHAVKKTTAKPVARVLFVKDMNSYEHGGPDFRPEILLGEGFALDYESRTIFYPAGASHTQIIKNLGAQNPLTRTIIFSIALLAEHNGLESVACESSLGQAPLYLHASSILTPRGALVFCGECTFGKTTISTQLLKDFPLLEDDQVTVLASPPEGAPMLPPRVVVFGDSRPKKTPSKTFPALDTGTAPLAGIFWLKKDPENAIEPIEQAEAAALMLNPMSNWQHPPAISHRLKLFRSVFQSVPCRRLAFKKESAPLVEFLKKEGYV